MTTIIVSQSVGHDLPNASGAAAGGSDQPVGPSRPIGSGGLMRRRTLDSVGGDTVVVELAGDAPWVAPALDRLGELLRLGENWNSYGARPIEPAAVASTLELLFRVMERDTPPPTIVPTNRGGLQLEWHAGGIDLEVESVSREHTHVSCDDQRRGVAWEAGLHGDLRRLRECLEDLTRRSS